MANVPRLFESTKVLPDLDQSGLGDAPHPEEIPFASPELAGIDPDAVSEPPLAAEPVSPPEPTTPADAPVDDTAAPTPTKSVKKTANDYADGEPEPSSDTEAQSDNEFTEELLGRAERYGYDADAARRFGAADNLEWALAQEDLRRAQWGQDQILALQQQAAAPTQPPPVQPPVQQPAAQQQPTPQQQAAGVLQKYELDREKLLAAGYDEETVSLLTGMNEHYFQQLTTLANETAQAKQAVSQQITGQSQAEAIARAQAFERDMDTFFESLGDDWKEEFGAGPMRNLDPQSAAHAKRMKVASVVGGLIVADEASNQPLNESTASLAQRALTALHFKKQKELALRETAQRVQQRRSQSLARPGGQRAAPVTGRDRAIKRAEAFARRMV